MKAIVQDRYGTPDVLEFGDIDEPVIGEDEVLVRVHAAGCRPGRVALHDGTAIPRASHDRVPRAEGPCPRVDLAGVVEAVGPTSRGSGGDEVMGTSEAGSFAELAVTPQDKLVPKPARLTFEQAAAMPVSGCTAYQAVDDVAKVRPGQKVLVIGASAASAARRPDREGAGRRGHRRVQHLEGGPGPIDRRRRRDRLHAAMTSRTGTGVGT